ncbi:MAG: MBL fold metallo-hydrolase [Pseudodesulfovibrio sp.]|uniref:Beta-lactamase domain protein n=1 Tax=Pseudodesulfovibrio aespoeensis (strain ATCC 700646 / DSM 10631 / Aspo-2) TaxID=643562 RepID=E6VY54_PSEA9|nr:MULTISPECIES: MBL fold metallo-hydrolase [Pseudodesulfovibrio]MBU4190809.1 MBL fold metallo-hydrolase [Pseudomonadota bacterium]ADU63868.1 beta-lactamase domain protein [Pseudodesulfovibrio aespoeensis Aspo-2]MBU4243786.1 MBL fold metallo-hydrolase [Pseudomonadota bacterium]MBU4378562.1 MBL fold metallo-hydrolase [Pseudomonadota bacterium]MBU4475705.1 MBL fold metallo-hydrolase [Pseudomonadota bacterium]
MEIKSFALGPLQTNCFVLAGDAQAVAVDPGGDPAPVLAYLKGKGLTLTHILNTHLHFDHTYGNKALAEATGAPILHGVDDAYLLETELGLGRMFGLPPVDPYEAQTVEPGQAVFAGFDCTVLATPGHSKGSLTFYFPEARAAFVGDLIFFRSIGRTDFEGGDLDELKRSVTSRIFTLPPETLLLSGHGPETTVGDEMNHNPFFAGF